MKIRTQNSNDFNKYVSKSGNGRKIPQLELDEKTNLLKPKLDEHGKRVYHDLVDDIQKFKDTNSLARILKTMSGDDLESLSIICNSPDEAKAKSVDLTQVVDSDAMVDFANKLRKAHLSVDDLMFAIKQSVDKASKKQVSPEKKENVPVKQQSPEKVENNENKK